MTINKEKPDEPEIVVTAVPEPGMVTAVGVEEKQPFGAGGQGRGNEPPIPLGHSRFYCSKCRSVRRRHPPPPPPVARAFVTILPLSLPRFARVFCPSAS